MPVTLNEIKDRLQGIEDALAGGVKHAMKLPLWLKITAGAVVLLLVVLLWTVFKKHDKPSEEYLQKISQMDSTLKYQQQTIDALQEGQAMRDSVIINQLEAIRNNRPTQTKIIHEYEKIPSDVKSYDRNKLRGEVTNF